MDSTSSQPRDTLDTYKLGQGADPYPFVVIQMVIQQDGESWEAHVIPVASDDELEVALGTSGYEARVAKEALKCLIPVRFGTHYMVIPVKKGFFELWIPFDS